VPKRTPTRDVFDRLDEPDDALASETTPPPEPETADSAPEDETAAPDSESDDEAVEVTSEDKETDGGQAPGRLRRRVVAALVVAALVGTLGLSSFLGWRLKQVDDTAAAGRAALEAARNYAVILTTLDAKDIDKNYQQALDGSTGEFKDEYSQGSAQLRQVLIDNHAGGKGMVIDAAIKSATKTKVEVLLFVDQSVTNAVIPSPRIDRNRVQMTMQLVDNRWLASKVEIL
jgi:Mce-associated membrane protein